jgi:hypothetical protein
MTEKREPQSPGSEPGTSSRIIHVELTTSISPRASLGANKGPKKRGKFLVELMTGAALWRGMNRWVDKVRRIDREQNRYQEQVVDPLTGDIVHHADEPLSEHRGHGSAKPSR